MHWQLLSHKAELKEALTISSSCSWEHEEPSDADDSPVGTTIQKNSAWATWDGQALSTHIQSRTETALKNLHVKWKADNSHSLYSWCKDFGRENSCKTPTARLADAARQVVCQDAHRVAEHGQNITMSPCVGQRPGSPMLSNRLTGMPLDIWRNDSSQGKIMN